MGEQMKGFKSTSILMNMEKCIELLNHYVMYLELMQLCM